MVSANTFQCKQLACQARKLLASNYLPPYPRSSYIELPGRKCPHMEVYILGRLEGGRGGEKITIATRISNVTSVLSIGVP